MYEISSNDRAVLLPQILLIEQILLLTTDRHRFSQIFAHSISVEFVESVINYTLELTYPGILYPHFNVFFIIFLRLNFLIEITPIKHIL
jgi:predicted transglutaminase-like protease